MNNEKNKELIKKLVENFIIQMNDWEKYSEKLDNNMDISETEKIESLKLKVNTIFNHFCTKKDRKMGRPNCLSWGLEGSYIYDLDKEHITTIEIINKNKAYVYTYIKKGLITEEHCYICVHKYNNWLIDSKKRKWDNDTKWSNIAL